MNSNSMKWQHFRSKFPFIRFFIGDVRDKNRLSLAFENIDLVAHAVP